MNMVIDPHLLSGNDPIKSHLKDLIGDLKKADTHMLSDVLQSAKSLAPGLPPEKRERFAELALIVDGPRYFMKVRGFTGFESGCHLEMIHQSIASIFDNLSGTPSDRAEIPEQFFSNFFVTQTMAQLYVFQYIQACKRYLGEKLGKPLNSMEFNGMQPSLGSDATLVVSVNEQDMSSLLKYVCKTPVYSSLLTLDHVSPIDDVSAEIQNLVFGNKRSVCETTAIRSILDSCEQNFCSVEAGGSMESLGLVFDALINPERDQVMLSNDSVFVSAITEVVVQSMPQKAKSIVKMFEDHPPEGVHQGLASERDLKLH